MEKNQSINQYSFISPSFEVVLSEIKSKIRLSMSGVTATKMHESGLVYKKNYGVSIVRMKELARGYEPNEELAKLLWNLKIRETMIMSTLLYPPEKKITMNLLSKLAYSPTLAIRCVNSNAKWSQIIGFMLTTRITHLMSYDDVQLVIQRSNQLSSTDDFQLYKSIGVALAKLCRMSEEVVTTVQWVVSEFEDSTERSKLFICNEVKQELLFLRD
jgi:hypothetical protein